MTKLEIYRCERCRKEFKVPHEAKVHTISFTDRSGEETIHDLCEGCYQNMVHATFTACEAVDKVISELIRRGEQIEI